MATHCVHLWRKDFIQYRILPVYAMETLSKALAKLSIPTSVCNFLSNDLVKLVVASSE